MPDPTPPANDFTVDNARLRLALPDNSQDVMLGIAIDQARDLLENLLNRKIGYQATQVEYAMPGPRSTVQLHRIPVDAIAQITIDQPYALGGSGQVVTYAGLDREAGVVYFQNWQRGVQLRIEYSGGTPPPALLWALWSTFDAVWASMQPGATTTGRVVQSESHTVPDVGTHTVRYENAAGGAGEYVGLIPGPVAAAAHLWRVHEC